MKTVYVEGQWPAYENMFINYGWDVSPTNCPEDADVLCLVGGEDVNPALYGHEAHHTVFPNNHLDQQTKSLYDRFRAKGKFIIGICRGGQFINVMNGGTMYQDVTNHGTPHKACRTVNGREYRVSSTHHQMMNPKWGDENAELMLFSPNQDTLGVIWDGAKGEFRVDNIKQDIEAVYFNKSKALAFQPHPEYAGYEECTEVFFDILEDCMAKAEETA